MQYKLQEKTVILRGPVTSVNRAIATSLVESGADVVLMDYEIKVHQRTVDHLLELREVSKNCGRAAAVQLPGTNFKSINDAIGRAAEYFGGIDIYIDSPRFARHFPLLNHPQIENDLVDQSLDLLQIPVMMSQCLLDQFSKRKRGRIVYLFQEVSRLGLRGTTVESATRMGLVSMAKSIHQETEIPNFTVNCVGYGLSEEYMLANYPGMTIREAELILKQAIPQAKLTSVDKIANVVAFLVSQLGAGISGQSISASEALNSLA